MLQYYSLPVDLADETVGKNPFNEQRFVTVRISKRRNIRKKYCMSISLWSVVRSRTSAIVLVLLEATHLQVLVMTLLSRDAASGKIVYGNGAQGAMLLVRHI